MSITTEAQFHEAIHKNIGSPSLKYITRQRGKHKKRIQISKIHASDWAISTINLSTRSVSVTVFLDFQQNSLSAADYSKLKSLAIAGIGQCWSRQINFNGDLFRVDLKVLDRKANSIDIDLKIEDGIKYGRSHNSGLVDATFIYNKGMYKGMNADADKDFMLVSAHEFGHSVLEYFGGADLSWSHKGSTSKILQSVMPTTLGYPSSGEIDLMKYYDDTKNALSYPDIYRRSIADEVDVKRLIWMSAVSVVK